MKPVFPIAKILSGGQTGVDQGALRAAKQAGIPTGGFVTAGFMTETGPQPSLAEFGLIELDSDRYHDRTAANVAAAHACVLFGDLSTPGSKLTRRLCVQSRPPKPLRVVPPGSRSLEIAHWLMSWPVWAPGEAYALLVAGPRESRCPGVGARVERFLGKVFEILRRESGEPREHAAVVD